MLHFANALFFGRPAEPRQTLANSEPFIHKIILFECTTKDSRIKKIKTPLRYRPRNKSRQTDKYFLLFLQYDDTYDALRL
jgi:hypothetical protein